MTKQEWDVLGEKALIIRTCDKNMVAQHKNFKWPESGYVECPDWEPTPTCGNGLHGLLDGYGDYGLLSNDIEAKWMICEVVRSECVVIDNQKAKFPRAFVVYVGDMATAITRISEWQIDLLAEDVRQGRVKEFSSGDYSTAASSGYSSKAASSGDYSKAASSGNYSTAASSGYYSTAASSGYSSTAASSGYSSKAASSGDYSKAASSGNSSKAASSGNYSTAASSGYSSTAASSGYSSKAASSGDYSKAASSGDSSKAASSGNSSKAASSGNYSTAASSGYSSTAASSGYSSKAASSGDYSKAAAKGKDTVAMVAGLNGRAMAGENGCFSLVYFDEKAKRNRVITGYVGEDGILADTLYKVVDGKLVKA